MKITKYVHSCLVIEDTGHVGIIDPGVYSWQSGLFDVSQLSKLDDIIITHEHPDHCHLPFVEALVAKFPQAHVYTNQSVATKLRAIGLKNLITQSDSIVTFFAAPHEHVEPIAHTPENIGIRYLGRLVDPGDSYQVPDTADILAFPITAPWGTLVRAATIIADVRPRYVLPLHDWHWRHEARTQIYEHLVNLFNEHGITFVPLQDGKPVEL
jgi:L-ascorbate metabolism protein UlaG (beta-lactamase superfamily)